MFNRCTISNTRNAESLDYSITFNFEYLDDMYSNWKDNDSLSDSKSSQGNLSLTAL